VAAALPVSVMLEVVQDGRAQHLLEVCAQYPLDTRLRNVGSSDVKIADGAVLA
jgi:hypothetical protein